MIEFKLIFGDSLQASRMRFSISLSLSLSLSLLSFFTLTLLAGSFELPPEEEVEQTRSQGTRGCPVEQGELILLGRNLKISSPQPTLLFWLSSSQPQETVLIVLESADPDRWSPVWQQKITVSGSGYLPVEIAEELSAGVPYVLTAGLLCQGETTHAKVLSTLLTRVGAPTPLDRFLSAYQSRKWPQVSVKKIEP
jgi:hypothetical protein